MLTRNVTSTKPIPNEPGATMTFRQLGWRSLAEAEEVRSGTVLRNIKNNIGGELLRDLQAMNRTEVAQNAEAAQAQDPLAKYDQATVLRYGIAGWSYPEKPTADNIDSLDVETARWAALEIIGLGMPPLEKDVEERFFGSPDSSMATPATATVALTAAMAPQGPQTNGSSL